jgi:DNA-binding response OmpR family regulator
MNTAAQPLDESRALAGLSLLVVEDDYLVAKEISMILQEHGANVLGPVPDVSRARALVAPGVPDCALLDINLKGQMVFELAEELVERGVPLVFTTGYDASFLPVHLRVMPCLRKPIDARELVRRVREESNTRRSIDPVKAN